MLHYSSDNEVQSMMRDNIAEQGRPLLYGKITSNCKL